MSPHEAFELAMDAFTKGIYAKNIEYSYSKNADLDEFRFIREVAGSPGQTSWIIQQAYRLFGTQMQVSKEVSDDLLTSDFAPATNFNDVPWPSKVVELYFEDPRLPTILLMKSKPSEAEKWFPGLINTLEEQEYVSAIIQEGTGTLAKCLSLRLKPNMYQGFLDESETEAMADLSVLNKTLTKQDNASFAVLIKLALKVFAFASIPHFKPAPLMKRQMHFGGKPDVRGRPARPAYRCVYAPNVRYMTPDRGADEEARHHDFKGRRGHFRFFKSERFTTWRNRWTYIRPVPGPDGKVPKVNMFKVRKPA